MTKAAENIERRLLVEEFRKLLIEHARARENRRDLTRRVQSKMGVKAMALGGLTLAELLECVTVADIVAVVWAINEDEE